MMKDHIIRQSDIHDVCPYCSREVGNKAWDSDFEIHTHYKVVKCDCGKRVSVKCDLITSGHSWEQDVIAAQNEPKIVKDVQTLIGKRRGKVETLESKMQIVKEYEWKFDTKKNE